MLLPLLAYGRFKCHNEQLRHRCRRTPHFRMASQIEKRPKDKKKSKSKFLFPDASHDDLNDNTIVLQSDLSLDTSTVDSRLLDEKSLQDSKNLDVLTKKKKIENVNERDKYSDSNCFELLFGNLNFRTFGSFFVVVNTA